LNNDGHSKKRSNASRPRGFLAEFFASLARDFFKFVAAFAIGTGGSAIACWYYGIPLVLSLIGGFIVLGLALALATDSWF
jgi:hypothetical protein